MKFVVIGAGSWGTAMGNVIADNGAQVKMWTIEESVYYEIKQHHRNSRYLTDITLNKNLDIELDFHKILEWQPDVFVIAVPSHAIRSFSEKYKKELTSNADYKPVFISLTKGIENDTLLRIDEILEQELGVTEDRFVALSGPSHAEEVGKRMPTAVVIASHNENLTKELREILSNEYFRVYSTTDVVGVETGGSVKNVFAIAAGILDGAGLGDNTKAALMTRALVEMRRLGAKLGAQNLTFSGLSGVGDLIVTCTSRHSRNRHVGEQLGKGKTLTDILNDMVQVAEGVKTTKSIWQLAQKYNLDMPITQKVYEVIYEDRDAKDSIRDLMLRELKSEN